MAEAYAVVPLSPLRKVIAARMVEAIQTIPHFRVGVDIEMDALGARRKELNTCHTESKISVNDLLIKACARALVQHPGINVQWAEGQIHRYHSANISVVVAVEGGLVTPVIRGAESKTVLEISQEMRELVARARRHGLKMDEIVGGTFSISNLGMYGVDEFDAIISPPQCAGLAVGRARPQVVVNEEGGTKTTGVLRATLSCDHRAIDGVSGGRFLTTLRQAIEHPRDLA